MTGFVDTNTAHKIETKNFKSPEPQFKAIWENSFDSMLIINDDRIILGVNDSFCLLTSKSRPELEGELFDLVFSSSFSSSDDYSPLLLLDTLPGKKLTLSVILWNDQKLTLEFVCIKINYSDKTSAFLLIIRDITEYIHVKEK